ncbi:hypothetical protein [Yinghuangia seranimata]|uniref:hypothetical protein n=1 Tax=Yinghuangia seranimata TaxID=408067 RepID=UPI00248CBB7A|nr:hypothetical protein [Yinghuangia seranimata]MDI2129562.1 hypothetical protein [Yinghuangia seranimata]
MPPSRLVGRRLLRVTSAWYHYGDNEPELLHVWLHMDGLGPVQAHTPGEGLALLLTKPHEPYTMDEYGSVTLDDDSPDVALTRFVGETVRAVRSITYRDGRFASPSGVVLEFDGGRVRLLAFGDGLVVGDDRRLGTVEACLHEEDDTGGHARGG